MKAPWLKPTWRKAWRDLWSTPARTVLVVLSLAIGLLAVGLIAASRTILVRELRRNLELAQAAQLLVTTSPLSADVLAELEALAEIAAVEGRADLSVRVQTASGEWRNLQLLSAPDYSAMKMDLVLPTQGQWPPRADELVIERASLDYLGVPLGQSVQLETATGVKHALRVVGVAHDIYQISPLIAAGAVGYVDAGTLVALGAPEGATQIHITTRAAYTTPEELARVSGRVRDLLEMRGARVVQILEITPGQHPLGNLVQSVIAILGVMGALALVLSGFLVVNTIMALLAEQVRQVGVLKALGARRGQIVQGYLVQVLALGGLAFVVAVPLTVVATQAFCGFVAGLINLDLADGGFPLEVVLLQAVLAVIAPVGAALWPIWGGTRVTVREALSSYGLSADAGPVAWLGRGLPLSVRLALRNVFRRRQRMALTLGTLTLASAMAIAVLSVRAATQHVLVDFARYFAHDVDIGLQVNASQADVARALALVPGIEHMEGWQVVGARLPDTTSAWGGRAITVWGVPAASRIWQFDLEAGRWLEPGDTDAIVVDTLLTQKYPEITVGRELTLLMQGRLLTWHVVGIVRAVPNGIPPSPFAFAEYSVLGERVDMVDQVAHIMVQTTRHDAAAQAEVARACEARLKGSGLALSSVVTGQDLQGSFASAFNIVVVLLLVMVVLLASVGGLGLMGLLSLNVLERQREIGVLRAIGARHSVVRSVVLVEGLCVSGLAWVLGVLVAVPLSAGLCTLVGLAFLQNALPFTFSIEGALVWLGVSVVLALIACWWPADKAVRQPVVEVLAYE